MSRLGAIRLTKHTGRQHKGTVIFFHGSGGTGDNMKEWVQALTRDFVFPHLNIIYPTAPLQPYTPAGSSMSNVWFDRERIAPNVPEQLDSISKIELEVKELIRKENEAGIPTNRIIVGGFSMGGSLALHTAYRWEQDVAGAFVCSSFLNDKSVVYKELSEKNNNLPPLIQIHGDQDSLVYMTWGEKTFSDLEKLGVKGEFHTMKGLDHSISRRGLNLIKEWIEKIIPPNVE